VFANWKYNIRKKTNVLKLAEHQTGKNTAPERPLTTLETRLLNFSGEAAVEGFDNLSAGAASPGRQGRQCLTKYFTNQNLF
jgi:hypothetical protein